MRIAIASTIVLSLLLIGPGCGGTGRSSKSPRPEAGPDSQQRDGDRQGDRPPSNDMQQQRRPCRVCVQPPARVRLELGKPAKVTWTITGTTLPVQARVRNKNPGAVEVAGGNDQYVTSSGGTPNVVTRNVTARSHGVFEVEVRVDEQELIATVYRRELRRIAAEMEAAAERLRAEGRRGRRTIPTAEVLAVLDAAVADLERSLHFEELAAFRDAVRERAIETRSEVLALSVAGHAGPAAIQLVTLRSSDEETSGEDVPAPPARSALSRFIAFLFGASKIGPLVEICVVTVPVSGATLLLYPKSASDYTERTTATRFPVYVGLYKWEIKMTGYLSSAGFVNFLTDPDRTFECRLRSRTGDANACDLVRDKLDRCGQ